jgi:hypothetical protein
MFNAGETHQVMCPFSAVLNQKPPMSQLELLSWTLEEGTRQAPSQIGEWPWLEHSGKEVRLEVRLYGQY